MTQTDTERTEDLVRRYRAFLAAKAQLATNTGLDVDPGEVHPLLKPHQRDMVCWGVRGGRRAWFASFGLGKTIVQLDAIRLILKKLTEGSNASRGRGLIVCPLGVRQEFARDARMIGLETTFVRSHTEALVPGIYLTNYESVRDGKLDPRGFDVVSLDEAAILRGFGGTKTFRELMRLYEGSSNYRFVATATPSPNEYIELLSYAAFLDILDVGQGKTRFFKRNSEKADALTLHPHMEREFWLWVSSWALFLQKPSDLGYSDEGYALPPLDVRWHEVPSETPAEAEFDRDGRGRLFRNAAMGVQEATAEKHSSIAARVAKMRVLVNEAPGDHFLLWHDFEAERHAIAAAVPEAVAVWGAQNLEERERRVADFSDGKIRMLASKPVLTGSGCNFQRHCHRAVFTGIGFKFHEFIQAIHRIHRFLQTEPVRIDLIYTEAERDIRKQLERKWAAHNELVARMGEIIREYGLSHEAMSRSLARSSGLDRREASGEGWRLVNNDAVEETAAMADGSADLIVTSIPFCYDETTEVLTRRGWLTFDRVTLQDEVATVHPADLCLEWQQPTHRLWERYDGEMLHFTGRSFDHMVTPNHHMLVARRGARFDPSQFRLVEAESVAGAYERSQRRTNTNGRILRGWRTCLVPPRRGDGKRPETIQIPPLPAGIRTGHGVELYWVETEDFMRLAGWYLSEGHADSFDTGRSGGRISIGQMAVNQGFRDEIEAMFLRIGLPPSMHTRQLTVWCRNLAWFLQQEFGHGAAEKRIPVWVKELHPDLLEILRDTMMKGDGSKALDCYVSISPQLRNDFQEICLATGWRAAVNDGKYVQTGSKQLYPEIRQAPERVPYSGMIGCLTVPNHMLVVRRNGKAFVSGNSTQYEYTPAYEDFGHSEDNAHFWAQMDFLTPELLRVLAPGRVAVIHVKDRIAPGGLTGLGFQTVQPFHAEAITHYTSHGFAYLGMRTVVTDVVRENNQTYRLGWTEQCKDGSRMGCGMPEYLLIFRKPPTDSSDGYADVPVVKDKASFSRSRWQTDAHGFWRSNGDRPVGPEDFEGLSHAKIFRLFRDHFTEGVYDHEAHVAIGEALEAKRKLPTGFMLLQPPSWHPDVWTDVARMRTLNMLQERHGRQLHLAPLQFDIVERLIRLHSMPGETVFDPFSGLGTVPYMAVKMGRRGLGVELNAQYFADSLVYLRAAEAEVSAPTLFDLVDTEAAS